MSHRGGVATLHLALPLSAPARPGPPRAPPRPGARSLPRGRPPRRRHGTPGDREGYPFLVARRLSDGDFAERTGRRGRAEPPGGGWAGVRKLRHPRVPFGRRRALPRPCGVGWGVPGSAASAANRNLYPLGHLKIQFCEQELCFFCLFGGFCVFLFLAINYMTSEGKTGSSPALLGPVAATPSCCRGGGLPSPAGGAGVNPKVGPPLRAAPLSSGAAARRCAPRCGAGGSAAAAGRAEGTGRPPIVPALPPAAPNPPPLSNTDTHFLSCGGSFVSACASLWERSVEHPV